MRTRPSPTTARQARAGLRPGWRGDRRAHPLLPPRPGDHCAARRDRRVPPRGGGPWPPVTHPPAQAARLRDRAGTGRPGRPALAVTGRSPVPLPATAGNCVSPRVRRPGLEPARFLRARSPARSTRVCSCRGNAANRAASNASSSYPVRHPRRCRGFSRRAPASPGTAQRPGRRSPLVRQPMTLTFSAWGPFWPWVMSNSTFCPSSRLR
jgi:hypothetical protein